MELLRSTVLALHPRVVHGFFTRRGGVSKSIYQSLNCAQISADSAADIQTNRDRVAAAMAVDATALCTPRQVHSATALVIDKPFDGVVPDADGTATAQPGLALGVMGADCAPILFSSAGDAVVAAAHAGWRGALNGILEETLRACDALGAAASRVDAAIGPCIQQASYEVGPELRDKFIDHDPVNRQLFEPGERDQFWFDLPGYIQQRLCAAGVRTVDNLGLDTRSDEQRFFSYRRSTLNAEPDYGRQISTIALRSAL
ncbi:MAG: polyphenol oxidase [Thiotrichales bacterium]|nr:polyphenol oxidase [Thiotrichales bacterium]